MKPIVHLIKFGLLIFAIGCANSSSTGEESIVETEGPQISFNKTEHNFGKIPYQGDARFDFTFKNTGSQPLVLQNVKSTCGCTVPEWPKEPISPGESAKITVKYNTRISGTFAKGITVYTNAAQPTVQLRIKGEVEKPAAGNM